MAESNNALAYSIYLCAGLLPWQLFSETILRMQNVFIEQSGFMKNANFPKSALPIYILVSASINFFIIFSLFLIFLLISGNFPGATILYIIPLLLIQQIFALSLGIILATLNVFFRDVGHSFAIVMQFWVWLTPIVYTFEIIPDKFIPYFDWNVMIPIINGYHHILLNNQWNDWGSLLPILIVSILLLISGYFLFKKLDKEMVDEF